MSGQRKQQTAPLKESPPRCGNCARAEKDSADRLFCKLKLPRYLTAVEDRRWRQVWADDCCDFHKSK